MIHVFSQIQFVSILEMISILYQSWEEKQVVVWFLTVHVQVQCVVAVGLMIMWQV